MRVILLPRSVALAFGLCAILSLSSIAPSRASQEVDKAPDLILHNGVVWTVDAKNSTAQAVAIKDGRFIAVGSNGSVLKLRGGGYKSRRPLCCAGVQRQPHSFCIGGAVP
jgi:hypothetical protein